LADRLADENVLHDRLADIHRVEHPEPPVVDEPDPGLALSRRLVQPDEFGGCVLVTTAHPIHEFLEQRWIMHESSPRSVGDRGRLQSNAMDAILTTHT
jgi:hypothetical protein